MSCFIDFIDINLWEDKVREIHLDKSRLRKSIWKITLAKTALTTSSILRTMDTVEQISIVPASSP